MMSRRGHVAFHLIAVEFGHQAYGDAGYRTDQRNPGGQPGTWCRADGAHGGGAVGFHDFRGNADGIGEVRIRRNDGSDGTFRKGAMANFTAVLAAETAVSPTEKGGKL